MPTAWPPYVASRAPPMPSRMVMIQPMLSSPGLRKRAIRPTIRPMMMVPMMPMNPPSLRLRGGRHSVVSDRGGCGVVRRNSAELPALPTEAGTNGGVDFGSAGRHQAGPTRSDGRSALGDQRLHLGDARLQSGGVLAAQGRMAHLAARLERLAVVMQVTVGDAQHLSGRRHRTEEVEHGALAHLGGGPQRQAGHGAQVVLELAAL